MWLASMWLKTLICFLFVFCCASRRPPKGPCTKALKEYEAMELPPLGMPKPRCDPDGSYAPYMYSGTSAVCVTKDGKFLHDYSLLRWDPNHENMKCKCARLEHKLHKQGKHTAAERLPCSPDGSFSKAFG